MSNTKNKNTGKVFEAQFKKSVPHYCLLQRLYDPPQSFVKSASTSFSNKNPCDFIMFDSVHAILYALELKTTKQKYMSFENVDSKDNKIKMIHRHQIIGLTNFSKYDNVVAGFLLNFRDEFLLIERTYFIEISLFNKMVLKLNKNSFNEIDLLLNGAVKITGIKKRINFVWDIDEFLCNYGWR